jgi:rare lipoprotein A
MKTRLLLAALAFAGAASVAHADNNPFSGARSIEVTMTREPDPETCEASQYGVGDGYQGRRTASGAIFNTYATSPYTVAHRTRPFGSVVTVTNLKNGKSIRAKVTDRGPYVAGRCVDLGRAAANALGMGGTARVSVQ